ncbi:MAG: heme lyase CcmF/NrfE family subunit [Gammaproteobacteria bacterium]|nr:heme lyase CcmF/NrfE family subunit [Gammaproteobacteria bacterium]
MIPEIGHFALIIALCIAMTQGVLSIAGAARDDHSWMAMSRPGAQAQFMFIALAFACLAYAFLNDDFSVTYVATNSNSLMPVQYKFAGIWGGHEGSLLLWMLMLSGWGYAVSIFSKNLPLEMVSRVLGVMSLISVGFISFMIFTSNPFDRLLPAAVDGRDLNPLLQDFGLIIHPPMLYMGYVGFSVAFAFAIAALLSGRFDSAWARWSRPWTTVAWVFMTMGIALGSWWAYYELGWGGWWFWDPVENASFMPWLMGTALIHSLAVTEKRGSFKNWTVLLAIFTFSLSLLGTFLVRSGVLTSVHAFATDPERGLFILIFLLLVIGSSLALFAWRAPRVGLGGEFKLVSRETMLLTANVILVVACGSVLLGTTYPLLLDGLGMGKISVGPPYFNAVFVPLVMVLVVVMCIGPFARWKQANVADLVKLVRVPLIAAAICALVVPFLAEEWKLLVSVGLFMAYWIMFSVIANIWMRVSMSTRKGSVLDKLKGLPRSYYGHNLAHFGVAVTIIGITCVSNYESEQDVRMEIGDTISIGPYVFRFDGAQEIQGPNYTASQGQIYITKNGKFETILRPEKRLYTVQRMPMTEAGIDTGLFRDLYVSLGEPLAAGAWSVRVYYKPFVDWIWGGAVFMALGGLLAVTDRRYRLARREAEEPVVKKASSEADVDIKKGLGATE